VAYGQTGAFLKLAAWRPGQEPEIAVQASPGTMVSLSDPQLRPTSERINFNGLTYSLRNNSSQPLVAFEMWWDLYFDNGEKMMRLPQISDGWLEGQILAPGENSAQSYDVQIHDMKGGRIIRVVGTVAYAEFEDGTRTGPDANELAHYLAAGRRRALEVYSKLLETARNQGREEVARMLSAPMFNSADADTDWAWNRLRTVYQKQGLQAALNEIDTRLARRAFIGN